MLSSNATVSDPRLLVVDGLLDVSVTHGLARITLAQAGSDGQPVPAGRIAVPLARLPAVAGGFLALMRKVEEARRVGGNTAQRPEGRGAGWTTATIRAESSHRDGRGATCSRLQR